MGRYSSQRRGEGWEGIAARGEEKVGKVAARRKGKAGKVAAIGEGKGGKVG